MGDDLSEASARDLAWESILRRDPRALVVALGGDGFRIPMPDSPDLATLRTVPPPPDRATMLELVTAADRMKVITTWERAKRLGGAFTEVRARSDEEPRVTLAILDLRHRFGVWIGVLAAFESPDTDPGRDTDAWAHHVPERPRTASLTTNGHAVVTGVDERVTRMLGWSAEQLLGHRTLEFIHPEDHERVIANWMEMLSTRSGSRIRLRHRTPDGRWVWLELESTFEPAEELEASVVTRQLTDITDEMSAQEEVRRRERLFTLLAESLPSGLAQIDAGRSIVYANARLATILGPSTSPDLEAQLESVAEADRRQLEESLQAVLAEGCDRTLEVTVQRPGADPRTCLFTLVALAGDAGPPGALITVEDITDRVRMREQLRIEATSDPLTGCHNRSSILAELDRALAGNDGAAAIFVDLDHFKEVNDRLGHAAGDEVLVRACLALNGQTRDHDVVGRLGGDEFLVVCRQVATPRDALAIAERMAAALNRDVDLLAAPPRRHRVALQGSVGVAHTDTAEDREALIAQADAAMYESKRRATGEPVLFTPGLRSPQGRPR